MTSAHPSRDELLSMAYVDDQLDPQARNEFEKRLSHEQDLAAEVTALRRLEMIARTAAPPEAIDFAWKRIDERPTQKGINGIGWVATIVGFIGIAAIIIQLIAHAHLPLWERASVGLCIGGLTLIFISIARRRWRSRHSDPYTSVKR